MATGEVVGVEALIRWQHPEKGILHPDLFLPMIEGNQLSIRIGEWVIDTALAQIRSWKVSGIDTSVSVNISAFHLQKDDFVDRIIDILSKYPKGLSSYLEFEILETSAFRDLDQVSRIIHDCKNLGINFSLDDFGTGYSSLTYFKQLQVSTIKIDKSFVHDLLDSKVDREILQGIVKLSSVLNREVLAEGVESISQGGVLKQLGCKLAQGFGISKPMPAGHFQQWIKQWAMNPFLGNDR